MRNTIIVSILLFIAVVLASVFYFGDLNKEEKKSVKPINYLPSDSFLIASFVNDATTDNIFKDFEIFEAMWGHDFQRQLSQLKQQLLRQKELSQYLADQEMFVSFHPEKDKVSSLFSIPSNEKIAPEILQQLLPKLSADFQFQQKDTLGIKLYGFTPPKSDSTFFVSYIDDMFFASYSKDLLCKVADKKTPKFDDKQLEFFHKNHNRNAPFTVYLPQQNLPALVDLSRRNKAGDFLRQFIHIKGQTAWNINYKQDALMLSGESELEDTKGQYIALFANQRKTTQRIYNYFPSNTALFIEYSFSDKKLWQDDLRAWHEATEDSKPLKGQADEIQKGRPSLLADMQTALGGDFAIVEQNNNDYLGFISIQDSSTFKSILSDMAESVGDSSYRFRYAQLPYRFYGEGLKAFSRPYFIIVDDLLVMANQLSTLQEYQRKWRRKDLLIGTLGFKNYEKIQGNEANVTVFINSKNAYNILSNNLTSNFSKNFRDKKNYGYQDFYSWSLQLTGNSGSFLSRLYAIYKSKNTLGLTPEWTYSMGSRLINGPYVFEHSDTSQFILAQEQDHTVHAVHPTGKKLWTSVFSGRIVGQVQQLKDRSLLLVTDRRRLYRFDTNGKGLDGFSTSIKAEPAFQPTYVDWGNQQMILIPSKNSVMAYSMDGGPISGWDNVTVDGEILGPVQFHDNKAIVTSSYGRLYFFDVNGSKVQEIDVPGDISFVSNAGIVQRDNKTYYYASDDQGDVYRMTPEGNTKKIYEGKWDKKYMADFENVHSTSAPDLIVMDGQQLQVYELGDSLQPVYDYTFTQNVSNRPYFFATGSAGLKQIGVAAQGTNLIYLFAENGTLVDGFPVEAQPLFYYGKINYNSSNYLVCTRRDFKLYAFRH
ncbi:PQQ-like beta-propeller repeat protein [Sphingobacterium humi]|uniref:PQQ-binding-like beta-propeller repeat protein n=1 Tax=Sphingobacterium humi TaxID=1796905 RepID=A0A6N8L3X8_9SPHI|nr:PQQ-like beta-propeller repeat protein [Sphingobacterium humi]MVZ64076.1 hypothetical protein [Sphingobacterium humi]